MTKAPKNNDPESPAGLHVDQDWKTEAKQEKDRLARAEAENQTRAARQMPPASFAVLLSSLATQILFALGLIEDPVSRQKMINLDLARHHIDMLDVLKQKTKGNLADDEQKALDQILYDMRMRFVDASKGEKPEAEGQTET